MKLALLALVLVSSPAFAATAFFTGQSQMVQSVTGAMVLNCQYSYGGQYFWRAFSGSCPIQIQIQ